MWLSSVIWLKAEEESAEKNTALIHQYNTIWHTLISFPLIKVLLDHFNDLTMQHSGVFFNEGWDEKRGLTNEWELIQNYTLKLLIHVALLQNNADAAAAAKTPIQTAWAVANFYCHV